MLGHINERNDRVNKNHQLVSDVFYEVSPEGEILWQWKMSDHLDELGFGPDAFNAMQTYPPEDNPVAGRPCRYGQARRRVRLDARQLPQLRGAQSLVQTKTR